MTSRRTVDGFSCFTIDALIGNSSHVDDASAAPADDCSTSSPPPPPPPPPPTTTTTTTLQYVVSCSMLEDPRRRPSPPPPPSTVDDGLDRRRAPLDDLGGSRHAFRVYRPSTFLQDVEDGGGEPSDGGGGGGGILATLQRWYSGDIDNDRWRTPITLQCDVSCTARRKPISDNVSTSVSPTGHLHSSCKYRPLILLLF